MISIRVWAAALAFALTLLGDLLFRASHPPGRAATLLVALGTFKTSGDAITVVASMLVAAMAGELLRKIRAEAMRAQQHRIDK